MTNLIIIENFDELRSAARRIDEGLSYLERKLDNVSNLGLSLDPGKTKQIGLDILQEYAEEIKAMKQSVNMCLKSNEDALQTDIKDTEQLSMFFEQIVDELQEMEAQLSAKGNYQPYEQPPVQHNIEELHNDDDMKENTRQSPETSFLEPENVLQKTETPENKKFHSTLLSVNINNVMHSLNNSLDQVVSPVSTRKETSRIGKNTTRKEYGTYHELDNRSLSEFCENNSIAMLEKKLNRTGDIVRTPEDPGMSVLTMQLLGRSNLKTKIYKENISDISYINKSPG